MDTKIFSLNCYGNASGYATLTPGANGITVCFNLKQVPKSKLTCLYYENELFEVGHVTPSSRRVCRLLSAKGARPSFGVFSGSDCIMFNGTHDALEQMNKYASSIINIKAKPAEPAEPPSSYYIKNKKYFDDVLSSCPHSPYLEQMIPDSKWAILEDCIVGIIRSPDSSILYICYGARGTASQSLPPELKDHCLFIPDPSSPDSGWWTLYQDPNTGEALPLKQ